MRGPKKTRAVKIRESKVRDSGRVGSGKAGSGARSAASERLASRMKDKARLVLRRIAGGAISKWQSEGGGGEPSEREQTARQTYNFGDKI